MTADFSMLVASLPGGLRRRRLKINLLKIHASGVGAVAKGYPRIYRVHKEGSFTCDRHLGPQSFLWKILPYRIYFLVQNSKRINLHHRALMLKFVIATWQDHGRRMEEVGSLSGRC
jgi:hypothetical protein